MKFVQVGPFTLLKTEKEFNQWVKDFQPDPVVKPPCYPIFAQIVLSKAKRVPNYLTLRDVNKMKRELRTAYVDIGVEEAKRSRLPENRGRRFDPSENLRKLDVSRNLEPQTDGEDEDERDIHAPYVVTPGSPHFALERNAPPAPIGNAGPYFRRERTQAMATIKFKRDGKIGTMDIACGYEETPDDWVQTIGRLRSLDGAHFISVQIEPSADDLKRKNLDPSAFPVKEYLAAI